MAIGGIIAACSFFISIISVGFGIYTNVYNLKLNEKKEVTQDASDLTTVIVKLENISNGITEIKTEMNTVKNDMKEEREKRIRLEESLKSAWKRIEVMEKEREVN